MKQTIQSNFKEQRLPCPLEWNQYGVFRLDSATKDWKLNPQYQRELKDGLESTTANNDNSAGAGFYGQMLHPYINYDNYQQAYNKILDVERVSNSLHMPYIRPDVCQYPNIVREKMYSAWGNRTKWDVYNKAELARMGKIQADKEK